MVSECEDKAFRWKREDAYITATGAAFAKRVMEDGLRVEGPFEGYYYAMVHTDQGQELWRAAADLEGCVEQTAVTANPAAGTISVDVKTFTGRGRVTAVSFTCVADANVASRVAYLYKVSGASLITLTLGAAFAAAATGTLYANRGWISAPGSAYLALPHVDFAPGDILRAAIANGQAGDDMSAITYSYKETV